MFTLLIKEEISYPIEIYCTNITPFIIISVLSLSYVHLGLVTEEIFYSIFSKFFPLGGDTYSGDAETQTLGLAYTSQVRYVI